MLNKIQPPYYEYYIFKNLKFLKYVYQIKHFFSGFIGEFFGQLKVLAKCSLLLTLPMTRYCPGLCTFCSSYTFLTISGVYFSQ